MFRTVVAFDLETTGLEDSAEIIEVGAVRLVDGRVVDRLSQLVRPSGAIPPAIERLTRITPKMVRDAPPIQEVLPRLLEFMGDAPLVGHNVDFDLGFTSRAAEQCGLAFNRHRHAWDTVPLAQILLPTLGNHRLGTVATALGVTLESAHRACDDAEATALVFQQLVELGAGLKPELRRLLRLVAHDTHSRQQDWLEQLDAWVAREGSRPPHPAADGRLADNVYIREAIGPETEDSERARWFTPGGLLARSIAGFQHRPQQEEMASAVVRGFREGRFQLVEAATGTGKSFAYLLPAILQGRELLARGERGVVVSTNTRNLQEQLFHKDVPLLGSALSGPLKAVLLKGRQNYLCGHRWKALLDELPQRATIDERLRLLPLVIWTDRTRTGDIEECTAFHPWVVPQLWAMLRSDARACANPGCRKGEGCWLNRVRRHVADAHVVIVNHSLLLSDLQTEGRILGEYGHLILDEAHNLVRSAERQFRSEFSFPALSRTLRAIYDGEDRGKGLLRQLRSAVLDPTDPNGAGNRVVRALEELAEGLAALQAPLQEYWTAYNTRQQALHGDAISATRYTYKARFTQANNPLLHHVDKHQALFAGVPGVRASLRALELELADLLEKKPDLAAVPAELAFQSQTLLELLDELDALADHADGEQVAWFEMHPVTRESQFLRCPLRIGRELADQLFSRLESLLLTSATLAVDGSFSYLQNSCGLNRLGREMDCLTLATPFDYERQARVLVPGWLPEPSARNRREFCRKLAELVADISTRFNKGTLMLFTSYSFLNTTLEELVNRVDYRRIPLLAQGKDGSRSDLLDAFREAGNAILLGTDSFWEGVDVPGDALQLLVMSKLPFDVPNEPMVEARTQALEAAGANAFMEYSVPEAVIRFRQGFGRLIRHEKDRGIFLLLDQRVVQKPYGSKFLDSLPVPTKRCIQSDDLMKKLSNFWEK
ncbi:MAG: hypothetical protein H6678_13220 [Candidatus Delongbacteria bacterium]|nr:hypothetical protein [Candidatus Delongbacteria bacterium]